MIYALVVPSPSTIGLLAVVRMSMGVATVECDGFKSPRLADKFKHECEERYAKDREEFAMSQVSLENRRIPKGFYENEN